MSTSHTGRSDRPTVDEASGQHEGDADQGVANLPVDLEKSMAVAFLDDRRTTTRLGFTAVCTWIAATMMLTGGGLMGVIARQQDNEGLLLAMVATSVPAMSLLVVAVVTTFLWSRRTRKITLETLQARLERLESMLRDG